MLRGEWVVGLRLTFALVGAVGQVCWTDAESGLVFLCCSIGWAIFAGSFLDCHCAGWMVSRG